MIENTMYKVSGKDPMYKTWHTSPTHLIMYIHAGHGSIVCADKLHSMDAGLLVYIAADTYHYTMPDDPACYTRSKIFLNPARIEKLMQPSGLGDAAPKALVCAPIPPEDRPAVETLFARLENPQECNYLLAASTVLELMYYLQHHAAESTDAPTGFISRTIAYIGDNIAWDMSLDDICRNVNVSKFHLCRCFREHTGMTVMDYILSTRIILAKNELTKTDESIMRISEKCGFSSVSYFCRVFHRKEGCTPLQYRKLHR